MADRSFQDYASSGELNELKIGGTGEEHTVDNRAQMGIMTFKNSLDLTIPLTTTFQKVDIFDTIDINAARGHMTYNPTLAQLTVNTTGVYKFRADATFELANNVDVEFAFYINGALVDPNNNPTFTGRGTGKNIPMGASRTLSLTVADTLEIHAKASSANDLTIKSSNISVEKTVY